MDPSKNAAKSDVYVPIMNYGRSTANGQRVYPNPDIDRQFRDNVAWMDNNLGEGMDFVWIEDDGYRDSTPAPSLKEAVAKTRTTGPGIFVVESLDRICSSDRTALLIVAEIVRNGWRFVACKDGIDTAQNENWRQVIKPLVAITYERSPARSFDVLQQRERNVDWLYQNVAGIVDITGFFDNGYTGEDPGPGLQRALAESRRHNTGIFVVETVATISSLNGTFQRIVSDLVARGWRFIARYEQFDTANWPKQQPA